MPIFNYRQEAKIITTETTEFSIEADTQEEADRIASTMTGYDITEGNGVTLGKTWINDNANQLISVEKNEGVPTLEVFRKDEDDQLLTTNVPG